MQIEKLLKKAEFFYQKSDWKTAQKYAEKILKSNEHKTDALIILGNISYQNHQIQDSLAYYLDALKMDSKNKVALINASAAYFEMKDYDHSYELSRQTLDIDSCNINALTLWGNSALELEKYQEAKEAFWHLLKIEPFNPWHYNSLSQMYQKTGDDERALLSGWKAVEISGGEKKQHINFGYLLYEIGNDSALKYADQWLKKYGSDSIVQHMGNALLENKKITRANREYVQEIFDEFANDFEEVLSGLNYCAPKFLFEEISQIYDEKKESNLQILDAGCGTGLCGKFLKRYASKKGLYGIDISEKMLEKAKQKECYDKLIQCDLEAFLEINKKQFDLIVSTDVFTYFGNLEKIISGMSRSLVKGGRILFTVSENKIDGSDYYLHVSGRFLHHPKYIEKLLRENGFLIEKIDEKILRSEGEKNVYGYIVSGVKKA